METTKTSIDRAAGLRAALAFYASEPHPLYTWDSERRKNKTKRDHQDWAKVFGISASYLRTIINNEPCNTVNYRPIITIMAERLSEIAGEHIAPEKLYEFADDKEVGNV